MGQPITWQYAVVWTPEAVQPSYTLFRRSSAGHSFLWAQVPGSQFAGTPSVDQALEELYNAVLALMEATA